MGAGGQRHAGDLQPRRLRLPQAERVAVPGPAEPGVAETGQHRRVRLAGSLCGQGARGVLRPHPSGALAGGASADSGHGDGGGDCARAHLHVNQRAVLQRQRRVSGDGGRVSLRGEPLRQRRGGNHSPHRFHRYPGVGVVPSGAEHGVAAHLRPADGESGGAERGEYLDGQIWPREGEVPLGPSGEGR